MNMKEYLLRKGGKKMTLFLCAVVGLIVGVVTIWLESKPKKGKKRKKRKGNKKRNGKRHQHQYADSGGSWFDYSSGSGSADSGCDNGSSDGGGCGGD